MKTTETKPEELKKIIKEIIDEWYLHLDEYPHLHEYMAASLVQSGVVAEKASAKTSGH